MGPRSIGIVIGDVAGKGIEAAVLTSLIRNTLRAHASERSKTPSEVLSLTNQAVHAATPPEAFATLFLGILDRKDGRLVYSNAGHTTAAIVREDAATELCPANGPILGGFAGIAFGQSEAYLEAGDLLFLYTDGLTEARGESEMFGEERLFQLLSSTSGATADVVSDVVGEVIAFSRGTLRDDMAILAVKSLGVDAEPIN